MKRVLVVDDDRLVLKLVTSMLENAFSVCSAASGPEALAILQDHEVDVLLTDVIMPGMNGGELIEEARGRHPSLRVCCMTGCLPNHPLPSLEGVTIIEKPFRCERLIETIQTVLDADAQAPLPVLQRNVDETFLNWHAAKRELEQILADVPSGIPSPDGTFRIQDASRKRSAAFTKYQRAVAEYKKALRH